MKAGLAVGAVAATAAIAGVAKVLGDSVRAAADAEASQAKVRRMLENNNISWAKHGRAIDGAIQKHAALTGFDDEELAESFANMVRTTGDVNEALKLNSLAADVARSKGMELAGRSHVRGSRASACSGRRRARGSSSRRSRTWKTPSA